MTQKIREEFFKMVNSHTLGEVYINKVFESWDGGEEKLAWMTARKHSGTFICESGAGITEKKMINQIYKRCGVEE